MLLTGASGFVGSHIADTLCAAAIPTAALLRPTSSRRFLQQCLPRLEIRDGSITDPASLVAALEGMTHVIHCAGVTKAVRPAEFHSVNHHGTRHLVQAINQAGSRIERLVHVSSLAAGGPSMTGVPVTEEMTPAPVSEYGKSKLAGEREVTEGCRAKFVVLRPPGVYGPRDDGFLSLYQAVSRHVLPLPDAQQILSLVYVEDLVRAVVHCLTHPKATGEVYYVCSPERITGRALSREIARQMGIWTIPLPLPSIAFWPICFLQEAKARIMNKPTLLSLAKYPELRAPGWICGAGKLEQQTGCRCPTGTVEGVGKTLKWYLENDWI